MYGKLFEQLYTGSMVGKGCAMFAVWGYVIANMKPERVVIEGETGRKIGYGAHVELNPGILGYILGAKEGDILRVIEELCGPDPKSRTKVEGGRRLIRLGEFDYRVVNGEHYRKLRTVEERREYQRVKQAEYRAKKKGGKSVPGVVEQVVAKLEREGNHEEAERAQEIEARRLELLQAGDGHGEPSAPGPGGVPDASDADEVLEPEPFGGGE